MTDPKVVVEPLPPEPPRRRRPSTLLRALVDVATNHPNTDARIGEPYATAETARQAASKLRTGKLAGDGRPDGTWTFHHRPIAGTAGWGVWAHFTPPEP